MRIALTLATLAISSAVTGMAASCGNLANLTPTCSITVGVGNTNTFTVSGLTLTNANQIGGGNVYQAGDVDVDIASGGGMTLLMTFSKNSSVSPGTGPTPGTVFLANSGQLSQFTLNYLVTLSTAAAGTVAFDAPATVNFGSANALGNAFAQSQMILDGTPGASCLALKNSNPGTTQGNCIMPGALTLTMAVHDIVTLSGGSGTANTSFGSITNLISSTFQADAPTVVPEPSTFALFGVALLAAGLIRRHSRPM